MKSEVAKFGYKKGDLREKAASNVCCVKWWLGCCLAHALSGHEAESDECDRSHEPNVLSGIRDFLDRDPSDLVAYIEVRRYVAHGRSNASAF